MARSKGCLTCKWRRKKCDEEKPSCRACTRNVLLCAWGESSHQPPCTSTTSTDAPSRRASGAPRTHSPPIAQSQPCSSSTVNPGRTASSSLGLSQDPHSLIQGLRSLHPQLNRDRPGFLYSFFLHRAAQVISIQDEASNPFIQILVPLAMQSDMVLHSLLTFSGVVCLQSCSQDIAHAVWEQYAQAVRSLKHNLTLYTSGRSELAILVLLTCLLLCAIEVCSTDTHERAFLHLRAAQTLITGAKSHFSNPTLFCFAAELYSYTVALLPSCSAEPDRHTVTDLRFCFNALTQNRTPLVGVLCGSAFSLFQLIPDVYSVSTAIHDVRQAGNAVPITLFLSRLRLHAAIQSWTPEIDDEDGIRCGLIYQKALLSLLDMAPPDEQGTGEGSLSTRRRLISNTISLLQVIPVESKHTTVLCWPLAVLGGYAEDLQHRGFIRNYLLRMAEKYRLGNMYQTVRLLEIIWARPDLPKMGPRCLLGAMESQGFRIMFT